MTNTNFIEDSFEQALITLFKDLGYAHECGYDIERDERQPLYEGVMRDALRRLNTHLSQAAFELLVNKLSDLQGGDLVQQNEQFMRWLQDGVELEDVDKDGATIYPRAWLVDFKNPKNNDLRVVNQWTVEQLERKRPDVVVMVNGLPLVVIELKSPTNESVGESDAYNQIKKYQAVIPSLFVYNAFNVTSDMLTSRAGTLTSNEERYMEWKTVDGQKESTALADYHTFFCGIFEPERFVDLLANFITFNSGDVKRFKVMAGYHQYFAVNKALRRALEAKESDGKIGVFWHTQGSGKSFSMVFLAHLLIRRIPHVTIVVVTDRKDLDQQLYGTFAQFSTFLRQQPQNAESRSQLTELLKDRASGGVIFTTIQKFEEGDGALSDRRDIIVMTDEAHRSQYGDEHWDTKALKTKKGMALKMREALPKASFIGFTGTPIATGDKDTQEVFGDYIDIYDMSQAVDDGATRPVYYESRVLNLDLNEEVTKELDTEFEKLAAVIDNEGDAETTKRNYSHLEQVLGCDATLEALVTDIISHYEETRADLLTGKAMIVALTREIGIKIYQKILEKRPSWTEKVKVVMTSSNKDPEEWLPILGNEAYRKELARKFKNDDDEMKIAIVRDMWLTGFDVPSLATMYVFKPMTGHNLMQAIARVNRVFPDKEGGLIVDYVGIAQALKNAMKAYTTRDMKRFGDPDIEKTALVRFEEELDVCRQQLHGYDYGDFLKGDDAQKANTLVGALNFMLATEREPKRKALIEHSKALNAALTLCRSKVEMPKRTETAFFDALRVMIGRCTATTQKHEAKAINERIMQLLEQSVVSNGVKLLTGAREFSLFDETFMSELARMKEKNIAMELLKRLLKERIKMLRRQNVVQSEKFSEMLSEALNQYIKGLLSNEEVIQALIDMAHQMKADEAAGAELGLTPEEKAFYDALAKPDVVKDLYTDEEFVAFAKELTSLLRQNSSIDWRNKEAGRAKMRVLIKRALKKHGYPPSEHQYALDAVMEQCNSWAEGIDESDFDDKTYQYAGRKEQMETYVLRDASMPMAAEKDADYGIATKP